MHRFFTILAKRYNASVIGVNVNHRERVTGYSKYTNFGRAVVGFSDVIGVDGGASLDSAVFIGNPPPCPGGTCPVTVPDKACAGATFTLCVAIGLFPEVINTFSVSIPPPIVVTAPAGGTVSIDVDGKVAAPFTVDTGACSDEISIELLFKSINEKFNSGFYLLSILGYIEGPMSRFLSI